MLHYGNDYYKQGGFVLTVAMLLLLVLSLLTLVVLHSSWMQSKMTNNTISEFKLLQLANDGMRAVQNKVKEVGVSHIVNSLAIHDLLKKDSSWWMANSQKLSISQKSVEYIIEHLTDVACQKIAKIPTVGVSYYRISLRVATKKRNYNVLLQTILVLPSKQPLVCKHLPVKVIKPGSQAWRQLK